MPIYSKHSEDVLSTCDERIQRVLNAVLEDGWDHSVLEGRRDEQSQNAAFASGHSTKKWPDSKHNVIPPALSKAVDVLPFPYSYIELDGKKGSDERLKAWVEGAMFIGYVLAKAKSMGIKMRSGLDWNSNHQLDEKFVDLPHLEIVD